MIRWFRGLSPPLRYAIYVGAAFLAFFVAAGVGATTAIVMGSGDSEPPEIGSGGTAESETPEATTVETTNGPGTPEEPASETTNSTENTAPEETDTGEAEPEEVAFVHSATDGNSRGDYTYISSPTIDGDSNAVVIATPVPDSESTASASALAFYGHNIGVWYEPQRQEWAIFNQDRAAVPAGSTFEVVIPPEDERFIHLATPDNTTDDTTYLDDPLTNGNPDAAVSVTQNWNPGGGRGVYNNHPVDVLYDEDEEQWAVFNRDGAPIPDGSAFNIAVSGTAS